MLEVGRNKILSRKLDKKITLSIGEAEHLPFDASSFDAVIVAFGVRNFENLEKGLKEIHRVLQRKGIALILEFSKPKMRLIQYLYNWYSKSILPILGGYISRNKLAYEYLPRTISEFPDGEYFCNIVKSAGFDTVQWYPQTFGIASIYLATKLR
jgi:demethylmenaquinone methyltransferase/2-methoxy-6-polyprenyl-1,4-benzoquinol methylase